MTKPRFVLPVLLVLAVPLTLAVLAGCGGGGSSSSEPASLAPARTPVFVEATLRPTGSVKANIEELASKVAGIDDLGAKIVSELEKSAGESGESVDYEKEVEPWLGERAGISLTGFDGNDFAHYAVVVQSTDPEATQDFIDHKVESDNKPDRKGSFEGVEYDVETDDGTTVGVIGDFLVVAKDEQAFKAAVSASNGESLAEADLFTGISGATPEGSAADVYVDIGGLLEESKNVDPETLSVLETLGLELEQATAMASLVPGSDRVEIDVATNLGNAEAAAPPASELLGSMPAGAVIALAGSEFGRSIGRVIDKIDAEGIPGQVPPHQLKSALKRVGIDLDKITASVGDAAAFAEGTDQGNLAGAVVLTTDNPTDAKNAVSSIGLLLRANGTPGVTAVSGRASGFSVHSEGLGPKPLVVAAEGARIAIGYGLPATLRGLTSESGPTISGLSSYKEAVGALGTSSISGFADGPLALRLAEGLIPADEKEGFLKAKPYLKKIGYIAIGSETEGELSIVKLIAGLAK